MDKKRVISFVFIFLIAFFPLVSASFKPGNLSKNIERVYAPKENLKGWINISFKDEGITGIFNSNFQGEIKLIDFLDKNSAPYTCIPSDCNETYNSSNPSATKSFSLNYGKEKLISLVLNGNIQQVDNLRFNISVSNQPACSNPLEIDILNDNEVEWTARKVREEFLCRYEGGKGCFNSSADSDEVLIGTNYYCEKIGLVKSEKFILGAWVKKGATAWQNDLLKMFLHDLNGNELANCNLPEPSTEENEVECAVNYSNDKIQQHYVCLRASQDTDYRIKRENSGENCGFYGTPKNPPSEKNDYYIFAKGAKFDSIGDFVFNQEEYEKQGNSGNLASYISRYISRKHNNNCSLGCSIPVRFKAYGNLNIILSDLNLRYSTSGGQILTDYFYDSAGKGAKLNTGFVKLDLSLSNITAPQKYGNYTLILYLNNDEILSEKIRVENVAVISGIFPLSAPAYVSTKFIASVSLPSGRNISEYNWDFGDGNITASTKNYATHAYPRIGNYNLTVEVKDSLGFTTSKKFTIKVVSPELLINSTIQKYKKRLSNLSSQLSLMPVWEKTEIENLIGVDRLTSELQNLEKEYNSATSDEEYVRIMANLTEMKVPASIKETPGGSMPFFVNVDEIKPEYFSEFGAGSYNKSEELYKRAIAIWNENNLDMKLEYKYISAHYDEGIENLLSIFKLKIKPEKSIDKKLYVLIEGKNIIISNKDYSRKDFADAVGVKLNKIENKDVEFAIAGDIFIDKLVLYLSPEFSLLELKEAAVCNSNRECEEGENWKNCRADCKPWGWVIILLIILFFAALTAYIILQWWYKERYEKYLFKNRNDLYNLMNFISNARSRGLNDKETAGKLKQAGWGGEQINYVFKKIAGKAIMPFDFFKLFKKDEKRKLKIPQQAGKPLYINRNAMQKNF